MGLIEARGRLNMKGETLSWLYPCISNQDAKSDVRTLGCKGRETKEPTRGNHVKFMTCLNIGCLDENPPGGTSKSPSDFAFGI